MPGSRKALQAWLCAALQLALTSSATCFFRNTEVHNRSYFSPAPSQLVLFLRHRHPCSYTTPSNLDKTVLRQFYNLDHQYYSFIFN